MNEANWTTNLINTLSSFSVTVGSERLPDPIFDQSVMILLLSTFVVVGHFGSIVTCAGSCHHLSDEWINVIV